MSGAWEPGTVAVATVRGVPGVRVTRIDFSTAMGQRLYGWIHNGPSADTARGVRIPDDEVTDVRPLVVLDLYRPEDHVSDIRWAAAQADRGPGSGGNLRLLADQIEAQTRPAFPEPETYGATVRDADGELWARNARSRWTYLGNALGVHSDVTWATLLRDHGPVEDPGATA